MQNLKSNGYIDHYVFSVYTGGKQQSYIKFGSMDTNAFIGEMQYVDTVNTQGWIVYGKEMSVGSPLNVIQFGFTVVWIDMSIPYLYLPTKYWNLFAVQVQKIYGNNITCSNGYCKFSKPCFQITDTTHDITLTMIDTLTHFDDKAAKMNLLSADLLVDGANFGDIGKCYIPVFYGQEAYSEVIFLG